MSGSLLVRGLLVGLVVSFLAVPAALADDPPSTTIEGTTTEEGSTETTAATTEPTATETTETSTTETETSTATTEEAEARAPDPWAETPNARRLLTVALRKRTVTRRWHSLMGKRRPHVDPPPIRLFESLLARRQWGARVWRIKAGRARVAAHHPPHLAAWRCIHASEGLWHDPNPPYYGGLQMDLTFQRQYGRALLRRKGTADNWRWFEQMWVAERALRAGRGFYPWPVAARRCGLI